jgi:pimeloyl-ACP methyl ester carboxylesterase
MSMPYANPEARKVPLASGHIADVLVAGEGPPLLFLHGAHGRSWPDFLQRLSQDFTVYAPLTPGAEEPDDLMDFDGFNDLALYYDDLLNALGAETAVVAGHAFGGMVAAEFAAYFPNRVAKLVLINAMGLWLDDTPVLDIHTEAPASVPSLLFSDPAGVVAREVLQPPTPEETGAFWLSTQLSLAAASHFYWPIPDRDLQRRLYRITSPTLLLWGQNDRVVPAAYADAFAAGIPQSEKRLIPGASHYPHLEHPDEVIHAVCAFAGVKMPELA